MELCRSSGTGETEAERRGHFSEGGNWGSCDERTTLGRMVIRPSAGLFLIEGQGLVAGRQSKAPQIAELDIVQPGRYAPGQLVAVEVQHYQSGEVA